MKSKRFHLHIFLLIVFSLLFRHPINAGTFSIDTSEKNYEKIKDLVGFLQYALNTIGDSRTSNHDKDIIITQSFLKIFRDPDVQVEDDLDPNRKTVTNKDVQAYLKDVDFFFKNARFTLDIQTIDTLKNDQGEKVYLVKMNRNLAAITIEGDTLNENKTRYLEVNFNPSTDDLKIASYYSTKLSEEEDLAHWWDDLDFEWRLFFTVHFNLPDSLGPDEIRKVLHIDTVNISDNPYINNLSPLAKCENLRYLNISNTSIQDLSPLRYLSQLQSVNLTGDRIEDISFLHYSSGIKELNLSGTEISDFSGLKYFPALEFLNLSSTSFAHPAELINNKYLKNLNLSGTHIESLDSIQATVSLEFLDISNTPIESLQPLLNFNQLQEISLEHTVIDDLSPLSHASNLKVINCQSTNISGIDALKNDRSLKRIYCDNSHVTRDIARAFNLDRPDVLIIFESEVLDKWWSALTIAWKKIFLNTANLNSIAGKEDLATILKLDSISLRGNPDISDLIPLSQFRNLAYLDCGNTGISELSPIDNSLEIRYLDVSNTRVNDLGILKNFKKLSYLNIEGSQVTDITPIRELRNLKNIVADHTVIPKTQFLDISRRFPDANVIYRTDSLKKWWDSLSAEWKTIFFQNYATSKGGAEDKWFLHRIARLERISIDSASISNIHPLTALSFLVSLKIERTSLQDIYIIGQLTSLKILKISRSPLIDFNPIKDCNNLEDLDLSNTRFEDPRILEGLNLLKRLNLSGTKIKNLNSIDYLGSLRQLDISNTKVRSLKALYGLQNLKSLVCYNSSIPRRSVELFKEINPDCQISNY